MNNPLSYQATEYDCGPTALRNAISYLYDREEIHPEIIKFIGLYCMDSYNQDGEPCKNGTSSVAMAFMANWLNHYGQMRKWPIHCQVLTPDEVHVSQNSQIIAALQQGGVAIVRVTLECAHYVLLTGVDGEYVYAFDPYYNPKDYQTALVRTIHGKADQMNRMIHWNALNREGQEDYSLGEVAKRECVLIFNTCSHAKATTMEYSI